MNRVCFDSSFLLAAVEPNLSIQGDGISCAPDLARARLAELIKNFEAKKQPS